MHTKITQARYTVFRFLFWIVLVWSTLASWPWSQSITLLNTEATQISQDLVNVEKERQFPSLKHCKIFILDMTRFAPAVDRKPCTRDERYQRSLERSMMMDGIDNGPDSVLNLQIQQHGWTRLLPNAIFASTLAAVDIDDADVVLVDMSCYADEDVLRWNGNGGYKGLSDARGALSRLMSTPAWTTTQGTGFVFMGPHPYSYLQAGKHGPCGLLNSYFLAAEPNQMCSIDQARTNMTIAPYSAVAHAFTLQQILKTERAHLALFRGSCNGNASGKRLRSFFAEDIAASKYATNPSVIVQCRPWDKNNNSKGQNHTETMREMVKSEFCISMAGDTPSSRRISESIISGCIPVFVGPPWHTLPLPNHIPWEHIALFFEIRNASRWPSAGHEDASIYSLFNRDAIKFDWPTIPANAIKYEVDEPREVIQELESYSGAAIAKLRSLVIAHRPSIMYGGHDLEHSSVGTLAIADDMCAYGQKTRVRDAWQNEKKRLSGGYLLSPTT